VGFDFNSQQRRFFCDRNWLRLGVRQIMSPIETIIGGVCALLLGIYLIYALLRPERF
jgi:K+-transporting ATPase KdpF subunit